MTQDKLGRVREILENSQNQERLLNSLSPMERAVAEAAIEG
jgi:hypothetical protein